MSSRNRSRASSAPMPRSRRIPAIAADIDWTAQHALVLGLGESGVSAVRWLLRRGARVTAIDTRAETAAAATLAPFNSDPRLSVHHAVAAPFADDWCADVTLITPSPGLSPHLVHGGPAAPLLAHARQLGIPVVGDIDLFEWAIDHAARAGSGMGIGSDPELALELPQVLAITGTNGKTTTTQMTLALLQRAGIDVQEAGNISPSLLDAVMAREDEGRFPSVWVLELSSFQLAMAQHFHPTAAALLNITEDHLDWHVDMQDYTAAKHRVFGFEKNGAPLLVQRVVNRQDSAVMAAVGGTGTSEVLPWISFGLDAPARPGDLGLVQEGLAWIVMADPQDPTRLHRLMPADALRVRGRHNALNAMAALALCRSVTPGLAPLLHALRDFRGGAHRMEWVANIDGIDFVDDSKGTNVGATVAALEGMEIPVVLIAGGDGKGQDFTDLAAAMARRVRMVVTIGRDGPAVARAAASAGVPCCSAASMEQAVTIATDAAAAGQVVLMSPACASLDMFRNYADRGRAFREAVARVARDRGVTC
jgi:UDP-N-acetylmuramoylalanine--D-glutamate ligase